VFPFLEGRRRKEEEGGTGEEEEEKSTEFHSSQIIPPYLVPAKIFSFLYTRPFYVL
jgi:hypothetical protein